MLKLYLIHFQLSSQSATLTIIMTSIYWLWDNEYYQGQLPKCHRKILIYSVQWNPSWSTPSWEITLSWETTFWEPCAITVFNMPFERDHHSFKTLFAEFWEWSWWCLTRVSLYSEERTDKCLIGLEISTTYTLDVWSSVGWIVVLPVGNIVLVWCITDARMLLLRFIPYFGPFVI